MYPHITPGGNHGTGHFYLAKNRTFLLCVDTSHSFFTAFAGGLINGIGSQHGHHPAGLLH
jgi:hypothetical protein